MPGPYERKTDRTYPNGTGRPNVEDKMAQITITLRQSEIEALAKKHERPALECREVIRAAIIAKRL